MVLGWPVSVHDVPVAQGEFDRYLPAILGLLERRATVEEFAQRLSDVATLDMGLGRISGADPSSVRRRRSLGGLWNKSQADHYVRKGASALFALIRDRL